MHNNVSHLGLSIFSLTFAGGNDDCNTAHAFIRAQSTLMRIMIAAGRSKVKSVFL